MAMQKTDWMYSIMASITLPFAPWSSERSTAKADEMRVANLSIDAERNDMQREMISSLRSALNKYATDDSLLHQYQNEIIPLTRQSAEAQTVAYQTGQVPITTVLDSRRMELMKQDDYLMVLMDRQMALIEIEMMVGAPLQ
jgi:outer membrane protein TolC